MADSGNATPQEGDGSQSPKTDTIIKRKFHNGWTSELEDMMADWADKAACYRWMHEKTSVLYGGRDRYFNIPIIILSGVTAGANFALNSIVGDDKDLAKWAQLGLGGASLVAGITQTLMNFYNYAKGSEAHRVAGISWGKFNRLLVIEMRLHPDERMDSLNFLKMFRIELDRLIEQSPVIPDQIISKFNALFRSPELVKPEITGILEHTKVYKDTNSRMKRIAAEAAISLHYKRGVIKQLAMDDLEGKTRKAAMEAAREVATQMIEQQKAVIAAALAAEQAAKAATSAAAAVNKPKASAGRSLVERQQQERRKELEAITKAKAGSVAELRNRFKEEGGIVPPGVPVILPSQVAAAVRRASVGLESAAAKAILAAATNAPSDNIEQVIQITDASDDKTVVMETEVSAPPATPAAVVVELNEIPSEDQPQSQQETEVEQSENVVVAEQEQSTEQPAQNEEDSAAAPTDEEEEETRQRRGWLW